MLAFAFSFQGRLKRLPFFLGGLALDLAFVVGLIGIVVGGAFAVESHHFASLVGLALCVLPLVGAMLWCSLSLHVRRIRDIGWDPAVVVFAWLIVNVADKLVLVRLLPTWAVGHLSYGTCLGFLVNLGLTLVLLFWPSHHEDGEDHHAIAAQLRSIPHAPVIPPRLTRAGAPKEFGRRGLG